MAVYDKENPYKVSFVVGNRLGIHGTPATLIFEVARDFDGRITYANLSRGGEPVDAGQIMQVMMQCAGKGSEVEFRIYPNRACDSKSLDGILDTVGRLERAVAHDDD